jgi:hypothetical protein
VAIVLATVLIICVTNTRVWKLGMIVVVISLAVATFLLFAYSLVCVGIDVYRRLYECKLEIESKKADLDSYRQEIEIEAVQAVLEKFNPDEHGLLGAVLDRRSGMVRNLDTGTTMSLDGTVTDRDLRVEQLVARQRALAALSGTTVVQRLAREIVQSEEKPAIQVSDNEWLELESGDIGGEVEV